MGPYGVWIVGGVGGGIRRRFFAGREVEGFIIGEVGKEFMGGIDVIVRSIIKRRIM